MKQASFVGGSTTRRSAFVAAALGLVAAFATPGLRAQDACDDVSGTWALALELPNGTQEVTLTIEQSDCQIAGTVVGQRETTIDDGMVEGSDVAFSTTVTDQDGQALVMSWAGAIDGDAMSGTISNDVVGSFDFSGTRSDG